MDQEFKHHAELGIAKATIREKPQGYSEQETQAARGQDLSYRILGLAAFASFAIALFFGNLLITLILALFWIVAFPAILLWRRRRLQKTRELQMAEFRKKQSGKSG